MPQHTKLFSTSFRFTEEVSTMVARSVLRCFINIIDRRNLAHQCQELDLGISKIWVTIMLSYYADSGRR